MRQEGAVLWRIADWGGGWKGAAVLILAAIGGSLICNAAGGSIGAFGFVTLHFVFLPFASLIVGALTVMKCIRPAHRGWRRVMCLAALLIPAAFCYLAATGDLIYVLEALNFPRMSDE